MDGRFQYPSKRFWCTVRCGIISRPCGTYASPLFGPEIRAILRDVSPLKRNGAGPGRQQARQRLQRGRLPHPVAAHQTHHFARLNGKGDIPQNMAFAVVRVDVLEHQGHPWWVVCHTRCGSVSSLMGDLGPAQGRFLAHGHPLGRLRPCLRR